MKLLDNYNRIGIWFTALAVIITSTIYYFAISYVLTGQVDQDLVVEENEIFSSVRLHNALPQIYESEDLKIIFERATDSVKRGFSNKDFYNKKEKETESGRALTSSVAVNGQLYKITIIESKVETEDLIRLIFYITLGLVSLLVLALYLMNRYVIRNLWQPFYQMLRQITAFNLTEHKTIDSLETNIDEFKAMNDEITAMSHRVLKDYTDLRSFVENASHELMTPIAIITAKMDNLVQEGLVSSTQGGFVEEIYQTLHRLKRLNKTMLTLARIENKLFQESEVLRMDDTVRETLKAFQEIFTERTFKVTANLHESTIKINRDLLNILLNNMLGNAVSHNKPGGSIQITVKPGLLTIANTGQGEALNEETIFQRFNKSASSEGTGLGLTLVKEICVNYNLTLQYRFDAPMHIFSVAF